MNNKYFRNDRGEACKTGGRIWTLPERWEVEAIGVGNLPTEKDFFANLNPAKGIQTLKANIPSTQQGILSTHDQTFIPVGPISHKYYRNSAGKIRTVDGRVPSLDEMAELERLPESSIVSVNQMGIHSGHPAEFFAQLRKTNPKAKAKVVTYIPSEKSISDWAEDTADDWTDAFTFDQLQEMGGYAAAFENKRSELLDKAGKVEALKREVGQYLDNPANLMQLSPARRLEVADKIDNYKKQKDEGFLRF